MKPVLKCYGYFITLAIFMLLSLINYFLTRDSDGFKRMNSLNLDLPKFYCYPEISAFEACENTDNYH